MRIVFKQTERFCKLIRRERSREYRSRDPKEARGEKEGNAVPISRKDEEDGGCGRCGVFETMIDRVDGRIFATTIYRYVLGIIAGGDKTRSGVGGVLV